MIFDDGNREIPGGVEGAPRRVVVVGAGMAGIAAANALTTAGVDCVVLEARDRVGGRLHTVDLAGGTVDLGAAWIHHPVGNPMTRIADALGVPRVSGDFRGDTVFVDSTDGAVTKIEASALNEFEDRFYAAVELYRGELGPDASVEDAARSFWAEVGATRWQEVFVRIFSEADSAAPMSDMSLAEFPLGNELYGGSGIGDFPVGGYREIVRGLTGGLEIRTNSPVESITWGADTVEVLLADATVEQGSHVIVTVPLGVLKAGTIRFGPALPGAKTDAIRRLGFGRFEKVALGLDGPLGTDKPHMYPMAEQDFRVVLAMERFIGKPAVVATAFGTSADVIAGSHPEQAVAHLMGHIRRVWGDVGEPTELRVTSWSTDPWSLGSYSYIPVGSSRADIETLAEPVGGRVLFAGEATSVSRMGFADGAFSTGIREAKRLLGRPDVELTL
ncbi:MAG TPA: NAD(P)/FAD-dependent oxidoreductase [Acidimicrobiia bacterium]